MPLQNRVRPDGEIISMAWRGNFMGNRGGQIHNHETKTLINKRWASKRWICCVLEFKNRQREVMGEGYTEMFFLDEVCALAAGHRPCFECRRAEANQFTIAWAKAFGAFTASRADTMDKLLHEQRTGQKPNLHIEEGEALPDGAMVKTSQGIYAKKKRTWLLWSGEGYTKSDITDTLMELLTPAAIVEVFRQGYHPHWHESAN